MPGRHPKLGQHFLVDERYRHRILEDIPLSGQDLVIEIGPGRGAMTWLLAKRAARVVAVEIDAGLAQELRQSLRQDRGVEILDRDILTTDLGLICHERGFRSCFVFGNVPYYITSPIIHHVFSFRSVLSAMAVVVQLEVAERLTATPGTRAYGYLSVLAQFYSRPRMAFRLPAGAFSPRPRVDSALVIFEIKTDLNRGGLADPHLMQGSGTKSSFLDFVKHCFSQKRKSVLNNLRGRYLRSQVEAALEALGLDDRTRAEQLSVDQLVQLYRELRRRETTRKADG